MLTGCRESSLATGFSKDTTRFATRDSSISIDAGVVLADRDGYMCLPFEQFGLPADARIEFIHSSCDCVEPSSVMYLTTSGKKAGAILLRYVAESTTPDAMATNPNGMSLGVVINVRLEDGTTYPLKLQMIHSFLAQEGLQ